MPRGRRAAAIAATGPPGSRRCDRPGRRSKGRARPAARPSARPAHRLRPSRHRGRRAGKRIGHVLAIAGSPRRNAATRSATRSCSASVISANDGSRRSRALRSSVTGRSPSPVAEPLPHRRGVQRDEVEDGRDAVLLEVGHQGVAGRPAVQEDVEGPVVALAVLAGRPAAGAAPPPPAGRAGRR